MFNKFENSKKSLKKYTQTKKTAKIFGTILKANKKRTRTLHLEMQNFEDYDTNLQYLLGKEANEYKYYFIYQENKKFYIQFASRNPKNLCLDKMANCNFFPPIGYKKFNQLMDDELFVAIKISSNIKYLILSENQMGRPKEEDKLKINEKLWQYCKIKNIGLF